MLVDAQIDINCCSKTGANALYVAVKRGLIEIVKYLIEELQFDANCCRTNGISTIGIAAEQGHLQIIKYLKSKGADICILSQKGISPLFLACRKNRHAVVQYFLSQKEYLTFIPGLNPDYDPVLFCVKNGNLDMIKLLIARNLDLTIQIGRAHV